ncbi:MAG: SDR family oxidoreductase [Alphaproteobacteria bacterium]|nr:SDR family oxidoreductase [Alphaproteobacteria bacterium]
MSNHTLAGRVAIVTGAGRGIGEAISTALHGAGACVLVADNGTGIDGHGADASVAEAVAGALGDRALAFTDSVASPEAVVEMVARVTSQFGGLDIVVNCAAILRDALVFKGEPADWDTVIRNNLSAAYYLIHAATPVMRQQFKDGHRGGGDQGRDGYDWGRIVNIGSTAGLYGNFGQANYGSAKAGLFSLARIAGLEMSRSNVTCNLVVPFAHSRVTDMIVPANEAQAQYKERAMKVPAHHVADFVTYLCSDLARNVTGQIFGVRGREVFLFSQPRPVATLVGAGDWTAADLAAAVDTQFRDHFTPLETDLEAFDTEPIV